jgi:hypothetical protein
MAKDQNIEPSFKQLPTVYAILSLVGGFKVSVGVQSHISGRHKIYSIHIPEWQGLQKVRPPKF